MENLQGTGVVEGRGRGQGGNKDRQPQVVPVLVQRELQEMAEKLKEQKILIDILLAERQDRQIERQLESCRLMECNLEELRRSRDVNSSKASHDRLSHKSPTLKRKLPWLNNQGKGKKVVRTKQQNYPRMPRPQPCPKCERYHQGTDCDGRQNCFKCQHPRHISRNCPLRDAKIGSQNLGQKSVQTGQQKQKFHPCWKWGNYHPGVACSMRPICSKCQEPGHISKNCSQEATEFGSQNIDQMLALLAVEAGESSEMVPDTIA
ncbi:hypothetical protein K1719_038494 [Acacia pycnantha]|nr:hypothetical protein K1719_038494 [Acacia pycnantha]